VKLARALALTLATALSPALASADVPPDPTRSRSFLATSPLADLVGEWKMAGHVGGHPVEYVARGEWALGGTFLHLALADLATPPLYSAEIYVGYDEVGDRFFCHWLDAFNARPSEALGYGRFEGDSLVLTFDDPAGPFRTSFSRRTDGTWRIAMRTKEAPGKWRMFADYFLERRKAQ